MIDIVKKFFNKENKTESPSEKSEHDIRIATCAVLLEMANIDGKFSDDEKKLIIRILRDDYKLSDQHTQELIDAAQKELSGSIDLWQFTNLINQNYSVDEKVQITEMVWRLAYVDGKLDSHEDYLMHKLANLLRLSHKQLIDAKMRVIHPEN